MGNYKEVKMSAEVLFNKWDPYVKLGERYPIKVIYSRTGEGYVEFEDPRPRLRGIDLTLKENDKKKILDYYENHTIPLEAVVTKQEDIGTPSIFADKFRYEIIVYFPQEMNKSNKSSSYWTCTQCGTKNDGLFCTSCGSRRSLGYWICSRCGNKLRDTQKFCGHCGTARPDQTGTRQITTGSSVSKREEGKFFSDNLVSTLHTPANSLSGGNNAQESQRLFDEGVTLKRQGKYDVALQKEIKAICLYPDSPNLSEWFMGLGKVFYLKRDYDKAVKAYSLACYRTFNNPMNFVGGKPSPVYQLSALHYGHALLDKGGALLADGYRNSIAGKGNPDGLTNYDQNCIQRGMEFVYPLYGKYKNGQAEREYKKFYEELIVSY